MRPELPSSKRAILVPDRAVYGPVVAAGSCGALFVVTEPDATLDEARALRGLVMNAIQAIAEGGMSA